MLARNSSFDPRMPRGLEPRTLRGPWLARSRVVVALLCAVSGYGAEDYIQLDETLVSGNQELPKVLYILPWREPTGRPDFEIKPEFAESEVFRRLYPPAYRRELEYYQTLHAVETEE